MINKSIIDSYQVVSGQDKYNRPGQPLDTIPIIIYHWIDNSGVQYSTMYLSFAEGMNIYMTMALR